MATITSKFVTADHPSCPFVRATLLSTFVIQQDRHAPNRLAHIHLLGKGRPQHGRTESRQRELAIRKQLPPRKSCAAIPRMHIVKKGLRRIVAAESTCAT
ncbi:hypothetical protein GCM10009764_67190 [Nocardia ninae]|uniref:Uncharacterized protein n=1 Tax=Nocardia ninae NBRC 108245 TaxID=1210091 RepID=A0A511M9U9_9NOCA|nr:hypothetical protein NN4_10250 [Nocardia ninae NBRC 108245]